MHRGAHELMHRCAGGSGRIAGEFGAGGIAVVDVSGEHGDGGRAVGMARDVADHLGQPYEGLEVRRPVLEITCQAYLFSESAAPAGAIGGALVQCFQISDGGRHQPRHRRGEYQMVDFVGAFFGLGFQPRELAFADHHALAGFQDPPVSGVDHDQPAAAEIPSITEPQPLVAVDLLVRPVGQVCQMRPGVALGGQ